MSEERLPQPLRLDKRQECPLPGPLEHGQAVVYVLFTKEALAALAANSKVKVLSSNARLIAVQLTTDEVGDWGTGGADTPHVVEG